MLQKEVKLLTDSTDSATTAAFSPDGLKLVISDEFGDIVRIWDINSGASLFSFKPYENGGADFVAFSPFGSVIVTKGDGMKMVWTTTGNKFSVDITDFPEHRRIYFWDATNGAQIGQLDDQDISFVAFDADWSVMATVIGKQIKIWAIQ